MANDPLFDITGKRVLIAGGAGGLGRVLAAALADRGARIAVADIRQDAAKDTMASLAGSGHASFRLDVRDETSCNEAVEKCRAALGGIDVLLNAAGAFKLAPATELAAADFAEVMAANTTGVFLMSRAAARAMIPAGGGRIVTLASVSSKVANPNYVAYATSKGALVQMTRILAMEWAPKNVMINGIGPAMIPTAMSEDFLSDPTRAAYAVSKIPAGRLGAPEDLIGMTVLLMSKASAFITGQTIFVDGGRTLL